MKRDSEMQQQGFDQQQQSAMMSDQQNSGQGQQPGHMMGGPYQPHQGQGQQPQVSTSGPNQPAQHPQGFNPQGQHFGEQQPQPHQDQQQQPMEVQTPENQQQATNGNGQVKAEPDGVVKEEKESPAKSDDEKENKAASGNKPKVLLTGFVKSQENELIAILSGLGGEVIPSQRAHQATHVVMPKLGRTISLLCAIPHVSFVLSHDWLRKSKEAGKFIGKNLCCPNRKVNPSLAFVISGEEEFVLKNDDFDRQFDCNLSKTLAKPNRQSLFKVCYFLTFSSHFS